MKRELDQTLIKPLDYIRSALLWIIPIVGWIYWIGACFSSVQNKRNFARGFILIGILSLILIYIVYIVIYCAFILLIFGVFYG